MAREIIGRKRELEQLRSVFNSDKAELVAVYGRRRIGKTFLVKEFFNGAFDYYATGIFEGSKQDACHRSRRPFYSCRLPPRFLPYLPLREVCSYK